MVRNYSTYSVKKTYNLKKRMIKITDYNNQPTTKRQVEQQIKQLADKLEINGKVINQKITELSPELNYQRLRISLFTFCLNY